MYDELRRLLIVAAPSAVSRVAFPALITDTARLARLVVQSGDTPDPAFHGVFAEALLHGLGLTPSDTVMLVEAVGLQFGQELKRSHIPPTVQLHYNRKLAHHLMLVRIKLAQINLAQF